MIHPRITHRRSALALVEEEFARVVEADKASGFLMLEAIKFCVVFFSFIP